MDLILGSTFEEQNETTENPGMPLSGHCRCVSINVSLQQCRAMLISLSRGRHAFTLISLDDQVAGLDAALAFPQKGSPNENRPEDKDASACPEREVSSPRLSRFRNNILYRIPTERLLVTSSHAPKAGG